VDGALSEPRHKLHGGERIDIAPVCDAPLLDVPEAIALDIRYEDASVLVVNKPPGLVVHPGSGNRAGTLLNALLHHDASLARLPRAGIVHRLDKDTSGLMVVARTEAAQRALVRQIARTTCCANISRSRTATWRAPSRSTPDRAPSRAAHDHGRGGARQAGAHARRASSSASASRHCCVPPGDGTHAPDPRAPRRDRPSHRGRPGVRRPSSQRRYAGLPAPGAACREAALAHR
jgi:23S rRNA-/tRNA-specific pseudouridylate synthase